MRKHGKYLKSTTHKSYLIETDQRMIRKNKLHLKPVFYFQRYNGENKAKENSKLQKTTHHQRIIIWKEILQNQMALGETYKDIGKYYF